MKKMRTIGLVSVAAVAIGGAAWIHCKQDLPAKIQNRAQTNSENGSSSSSAKPGKDPASEVAPSNADEDALGLTKTLGEACDLLKANPDAPERLALFLELIEDLARISPSRAVVWARGVTDASHKSRAFLAVARGYASKCPADAASWAVSQEDLERGHAVSEILKVIAPADPAIASQLVTSLSANNPTEALSYGNSLVAVLCGVGRFQQSALFATGFPEAHRGELLSAAFSRWAEQEPRLAMEAAMQLEDPGNKENASKAVIARWAYAEPKTVMDFANQITSSETRLFALSVAMPRLVELDPLAAALWFKEQPPSSELDKGVAAIATHPGVVGKPELALTWAFEINDRELRARAVATVLNRWATTDAAAARRYIGTVNQISDPEREVLESAFSPGFKPLLFSE